MVCKKDIMAYIREVENASGGEGIVTFTLRLRPELVIQDLRHCPRAILW
jgi:hypothetical protein